MQEEQPGLGVAVEDDVREPRQYKVMLHNDDYTTMEFVILVLVNVFRKSEDVPPVLADTLAIAKSAGVQGFWLQLGISHAESEKRAAEAGLAVVANRCIKVELASLKLAGE